MPRKNTNFFNTKIKEKTIENIHLVKSNSKLENQIKKINIQEFKKIEQQLTYILNDNSNVSEKLVSIEKLLLDGQNIAQEMLRFGLTGLLSKIANLSTTIKNSESD